MIRMDHVIQTRRVTAHILDAKKQERLGEASQDIYKPFQHRVRTRANRQLRSYERIALRGVQGRLATCTTITTAAHCWVGRWWCGRFPFWEPRERGILLTYVVSFCPRECPWASPECGCLHTQTDTQHNPCYMERGNAGSAIICQRCSCRSIICLNAKRLLLQEKRV